MDSIDAILKMAANAANSPPPAGGDDLAEDQGFEADCDESLVEDAIEDLDHDNQKKVLHAANKMKVDENDPVWFMIKAFASQKKFNDDLEKARINAVAHANAEIKDAVQLAVAESVKLSGKKLNEYNHNLIEQQAKNAALADKNKMGLFGKMGWTFLILTASLVIGMGSTAITTYAFSKDTIYLNGNMYQADPSSVRNLQGKTYIIIKKIR